MNFVTFQSVASGYRRQGAGIKTSATLCLGTSGLKVREIQDRPRDQDPFQRVTIKAGEVKFLDLVVTGERMAVWGDDGWTYITGNLIFPR